MVMGEAVITAVEAQQRRLEEEVLYGLESLPIEVQEAILAEMDMIDVLYSQQCSQQERSRRLLSVALSAS